MSESEKINQLVQDIYGYFGERERQWVKENPESCLVSLLEEIKKELPEVSATLRFTVEFGTIREFKERKGRQQAVKA